MVSRRNARLWHLLTAAVAGVALVLQLLLVISGASVLVTEEPPGLGERLSRFVRYFTVESNLAVLLTAVGLARNPGRDGRVWRVLRLDALVGIFVTAVVHFFLLRPLLDLTGWSAVADTLLHVVVPLLAVLGWVLFGPRPRVDRRVVGWSLLWPVVWLGLTLLLGGLSGWYPYPFLDSRQVGAGGVVAACLGVALALVGLTFGVGGLEERLPPFPRPARDGRSGT
ncbi:MAG: hypothetical protein JWP61_2235 [Friedmanniella sp.]|nr:hypothetical protein [Friedmanniella sp.]